MPSVDFDSKPADVRWPVTRGDDETMPLQFFTTYIGPDDAGNVPLDITGRTYAGKIATGRGGDVIATITYTVDDATTGQVTASISDTITDALPNSIYVWDCVENAGTSNETTLIVGRMHVSGRATV